MKNSVKKVMIIAAALIAAALLLILFLPREKGQDISVPDGAKAGDLILEPYQVEINSGEYDADRGILVVPESRSTDSPRLIALPVLRIHAASGPSGAPIFYLAGGPGNSNMDFTPPRELIAGHDFVLVGYRGVDGSVSLDCPEVKKAVKGTGNDLLSPDSIAHIGEAYRQGAARLRAEGIDLDAYTMPDVADDLDAARVALGYDRIDLLSQSYGTRVAQIYAYRYPESIGRSAMIGVNPPGCFVWQPEITDRLLYYYADLYAQEMGSAARTQDLARTMRHVTQNMPKRWLFLPIDPGKVRAVTFAMLFQRGTAATVFDAYIAAEEGDPSGLALMSLAYDFIMPSMFNWGDSATKAVSADYDPSIDYIAEMDPPDSIIGAPLSKLLWGSAPYFPIQSIAEEYRRAHPSDVETLLVSGSVDFSTPAENATRLLLPYLNRGKQVILSEMGHTQDMWSVQKQATIRLLTSFYETGEADDSLYTYAPMDFSVSMGFPAIAKIALGAVVLVVLLIAVVVWLIIRRRRRRRAGHTARPRSGEISAEAR